MGLRVVIVGEGAPARALADGIAGEGARAMLVDALPSPQVAAGEVDALVWAWADPAAGAPKPLRDTSPEEWAAAAEAPLTRFLGFLQQAHALLQDSGGRVIVLIPSLAMSGAAGLVPWGTAAEGQRSIAKAVARRWGPLGIRVNSLAVPAHLLVGGEQPLDRTGLPPLSLSPPALAGEVAALVVSLLGPAWGAVTGTTIGADGGRWMTP